MCGFLDVGMFASMAHGCRLSMWEMALARGNTVPMLMSTHDDNCFCRGLVTSGFCWVPSWIGAEILDDLV